MHIHVLFFGQLKEIAGRAEDHVEVANGARLGDVFASCAEAHPRLAGFRTSTVASINQEFSAWDAAVRADDEVAFLPPVSGGQSTPAETVAAEDSYELVRTPIRALEIVTRCKAPADGAVVAFDGIVRDNSQGRRTLHLDYEAYEPMALAKMREIGAEIHARFVVHGVAIVHRLGRLEIGETSVFIAVSSPHRRAAFDACRYAIDALKHTVPIWKKEYFADGAVWAEGEMPPVKPAGPGTESNS